MRVLYDSQGFDMQKHGGVTRSFVELYKHFPKEVQARFGVIETDNVYLNNIGFPASGTSYRNFPFGEDNLVKHFLYKLYYNLKYKRYKEWDKTPQLNMLESVRQIKEGEYEIFHPTFFAPYFLPYLGNKPMVLTVHDMIVELFPHYFSSTNNQLIWKNILIPKAKHLIVVSECTKRDLQRLFHISDEKISVIYHGADQTPYIPSGIRPIENEYLLFVGDRWLYKNFTKFVYAVVPVLKRHKDLFVICTGSPFSQDEIRLLKENELLERFVHKFIQSDQELFDVYHNALAFVYPSEYEGFGIPILEAYKAGCPVMLNNSSCFPEIAGDAAIYFDMNDKGTDFESQFECLYRMNGNERNSLLHKQRERLMRYTWERASEQLAEVYRQLC